MSENVFVGRIPMLDRGGLTAGYELIARDGVDDADAFGDLDLYTRKLLSLAVHRVGMEELIGGRNVWLRMGPNVLREGHHQVLPPERTVLEMPLTHFADPELREDLDAARRYGYRLAFDASGIGAGLDPFQHADSVGAAAIYDAVKVSVEQRRSWLWSMTVAEAHRRNVQLVVVGVRDQHDALYCNEGVAWLQGPYLFDPVIGDAAKRVDRLAALQLLSQLERPGVSFEDLERVISRDPSLTVRILTLANSGMFSLSRRIDSVRGALVMLGVRTVRQLALTIAMLSIGGVPPEVTTTALVRARQCEMLAAAHTLRSEVGFTVGILSLAGVFAGMPTNEALAQLPITSEVVAAIADGEGVYSWPLKAALACETGTVAAFFAEGGYPPELSVGELAESYLEGIQWAERLRSGAGR